MDLVETQGNPTVETPAENASLNESLTDIMGSMAQSKTPDAKPEANEGEKADGTEKSQSEAPAWTSQLPEEMRSNSDVMKQLGKFAKIGELAKSYAELESKLGNSIVRPGKDASDDEVNAFYQKLGKPKSADKYSIDVKEAQHFKELAYKNNLTDEQAQGIFNGLKEVGEQMVLQKDEQLKMRAKATEENLKKEYGNDYQTKLELCKRGVLAYGGKELGLKLQESGLLFDQDIVKMFIKLGEQNAEAGASVKTAKANSGYKSTADGGTFTFSGL